MKYLPTFISVVALVWAAAMALRCDRLPFFVPAYIITQCAFALVAFLSLQRVVIRSESYTYFFAISFGLVLLSGLGFIVWMSMQHGSALGWTLLVSCLAHAGVIGLVIYTQIQKITPSVPSHLQLAVFQGAVLVFYGTVALISLALPLTPEIRIATIALGGFWMAVGVFSFAWSIGLLRHPAMWLTLNNFLPAMLAIVAFGWMALQLGKTQGELSHAVSQPVRFENGVEAQ